MADLRAELKEWERAFRAEHARDPTKDDIRQHPPIAAKYKEYNRLKAAKGKSADAKPSASLSSSSKAPPRAAESSNVFKTPTKPKPARAARPRASEPTSSTDGPGPAAGGGSPSKRPSSTKDRPSPSFVLANSPSKLRALAAAHSTSGSPNRPQSGAWAGATLAPSDALTVPGPGSGSPQKRALNPFASPSKGGTFGELERAEKQRLRQRKRAAREKANGVLGGKATGQGAGWGGASSVPGGGGREFARTESLGSTRGMDLDEVDEFFSSQSSAAPTQSQAHAPSQGSQRLLAQLAKASPVRFEASLAAADDDEVFGPSPVKRSAPAGASSLFGLSPSSASAAQPAKRVFKPLVPDSPPLPLPAASAPAPAATKPKPFTSSLPPSALPASSSTVSRKRPPAPGAEDDPDAALEDGDDDFYADALDDAEAALGAGGKTKGKGKKGAAKAKAKGKERAAPAKRKRVTAGAATNGRAKGKGKAKAGADAASSDETDMDLDADADGDADPEVRVVSSSRARGELVLDVTRDPALGLGSGRERLVIHETGHAARVRALEREEKRRRAEERARAAAAAAGEEVGEEGGEDGEEGALDVRIGESEDGEDEDELVGDGASLFHRRAGLDLLSRLRADAAAESSEGGGTSPSAEDFGASLPADLAAVLSLRASPQKAHASAAAKQRQVARLLGEPGAGAAGRHRRRQKGLLELDDGEGEEGDGANAEDAEGEGDDDWDEEPDGWKATGDAMDGYYSADGW